MRARGFTLLEVMISLAILAVGLVAISNLNGGAVQMHAYSRAATQASLLLRGKMLDVEDDLQKNGFSDFNDEKHGSFENEGAPQFSWTAEILKPDVQLDPAQLISLLGGATGATGTGGGSASGSTGSGGLQGAATQLLGALQGGQLPTGGGANAMLAGPLGGMLSSQATTFIETLKKSVREVRLTVSWMDGKRPLNVSASQMIVILPETVNKQPGTPNTAQPQPGQPQQPGQVQQPRPISSDPGQATQ